MAAVNGAKRIARGRFHSGESSRPFPQRQAQPPRLIASKEPSILCSTESSSNLPVANEASSDSAFDMSWRSEEHTSELQSADHLVCRLLLEKKKQRPNYETNAINVYRDKS